MVRVLNWSSPFLVLALSACAGSPPSPTLALSPDAPTTTDDIVLDITDAAELDVAVTYDVAWYRDGEIVNSVTDETTVPASLTAKGQTWLAQVTAVDDKERLSATVDLAVVVVNTAPTATVEAGPESPATDDDLVATATGLDADGDTLTYAWTWLRDGVDADVSSDTVPASMTAKGEVWTVQIVPNDGEVDGDLAEATLSVGNTPPEAARVTLDPAEVYETTTVTATAEGSDADGDGIDWTYTWSVNGVVLLDVEGPQLTGTDFDKGDRITVEAQPSDGLVDGNVVVSDEITVLNSAPSVNRAIISPTDAAEDSSLTCAGTDWTDVDGDIEGYRTGWEVNGALVSTEASLNGADFDKGDSVVCVLTPWDGTDEGEAVRSNAVIVQNTVPVLASAALTPSSPKEGDTLSVTLGTASDIDGDKITFTYAWTVDGKLAGTGTTLDSTSFAKGEVITVAVTPNDGDADGATVTSGAVTVVNTAPVMSSVTLSPASVRTNDTITASPVATDADGDTITFSYAWSVNSKPVGATGATLDGGTYFDKGDEVDVLVTPNDGDDDGSPLRSSATTILNTAPSISSVAVSPAKPTTETALGCTPSGWSDDDSDSASYIYAWTKNGTTIAKEISSTLAASNFDRDDEVVCQVTPNDGTDDGKTVSSSVVTILNAAPSVGSVGLSSTSPTTNATLTATARSVSDPDGDTVSLTYDWFVDTTRVSSTTTTSTTASLVGSFFDKGDEVYVRVTPKDASATGTAVTSATATVANTPPTIAGARILPTTLYTTSTATASLSGVKDADGDTLSYRYTWYVAGTVVGGTGSSLSGTFFSKGQVVQFVVSVSDGDSSVSRAATAVTVANSLPTAPKIALTPTTPDDTENLVCSVTAAATDADGDKLSYDIDWYLNGTLWTGRTSTTSRSGDTILAADTKATQKWQCFASAWDGSAYGPDASSGTVTVVASFTPPKVGTTGTYGVASGGDAWQVCRADSSTAWVAANTSGIYSFHAICKNFGYLGANAWGGTCGTLCGYCGTVGDERYSSTGTVGVLSGNYSATQVYYTVHWRCAR